MVILLQWGFIYFTFLLWYAAYGLGYVIDIDEKYPFNCKEDIVCQDIYYYVMKSAVIVIIFIFFVILAKQYKL